MEGTKMKKNKRKNHNLSIFQYQTIMENTKSSILRTNLLNIKIVTTLIFITIFSASLLAQDVNNIFQYRTFAEIKYKPVKNLNVYLSPEFRFDESFALDKYHIEAGAAYKLTKAFSVGLNYRFIINPRDVKETEYYSRFNLYAKLKQKYGDFTPYIKLGYANYADDDQDNELTNYMRYKAGMTYDIPKCKITPKIGIEAFHNLSDKEISKVRYSVGADYKLFKKNYISLKYKIDYFRTEYTNKHILQLGYKIKL